MHRFGWIAACALLMATVLLAAPILPKAGTLPDETASLAGVKQVRIEVLRVSPLLSKFDIKPTRLEDAFRDRVEEAGFQIVEDANAPRCSLIVKTAVDIDLPEAVSLTVSILVHQKVRVHRIGRDLTLPTATLQKTVLTTVARTEETLFDSLSALVQFLAQMVESANVKTPS